MQPVEAIHGHLVPGARLEEQRDLFQQVGGRSEAASSQPHELPASVLAQPLSVVCELLDDLTVHLITQDVLGEGAKSGPIRTREQKVA